MKQIKAYCFFFRNLYTNMVNIKINVKIEQFRYITKNSTFLKNVRFVDCDTNS